MPRKKLSVDPAPEQAQSLLSAAPASSVPPERLAKMQRLYAIAGDPACAAEFEALRAELDAAK